MADFPSTEIRDNFNRTNEGPPMTGWPTWLSNGLKVLTNQCAPADGSDNGAYFSTPMTRPDVESYVTISTLPVTGGVTGVIARANPTGAGFNGDWYMVSHTVSAGTDTILIQKQVDPSTADIGGPFNQDLAAGDKLGIRCVGTTIEAWASLSGVWTLIGSAVDSDIDGAAPKNKLALYNFGNASATARYDDFGGGTLAPAVLPDANPNLIYLRKNR